MSSNVEPPAAMSAEAMAATIAGLQAELATKDAEHAAKVAALEDSLTERITADLAELGHHKLRENGVVGAAS